MTSSIGQNIEILCSEHGLDRDLVIEAMKDAVKAAARKQFRTHDKTGESIQVDWNMEEGLIEISAHKEVVAEVENPSTEMSLAEAQELAGDEVEIGDLLEIPLPTEELGRIAAQTAKQILVQKVREAVRSKVYDEYFERIGEIFNGQVKRFERGDMIVELSNNLEAIVPKREQVRSETWTINDRIRVVIKDVSKELRGQQIVASRASAELLKRLFEMEVPEIYDGTVVIKSAVREPGDRAKIAVSSNEKDVDPVGACVGMKGSRVQSIIKELRGEKIDIIEWSDEPSIFAANALSPAKVSQVRITDIDNRKMEVIVPEDQLSLAIGKFGQNVRLATKLVGWNIDIISEEVLKSEIAQQMSEMMASGEAVPLAALQIVNEAQADTLNEKGIDDIDKLAVLSIDDLVEMLDISLDEAQEILGTAQKVLEARSAKSEDEAEETEGESDSQVETDSVETTSEDETVEETMEEAADETAESAETEIVSIDSDDQNAVSVEAESVEEAEEVIEDETSASEETTGESTAVENTETSETDNESVISDEPTEETSEAETSEMSEDTDAGYDAAVAGEETPEDETVEDEASETDETEDSSEIYNEIPTETAEITDADTEAMTEIENELMIEPSPELNSKMISGEDASENFEAENTETETAETSVEEKEME
jgi:transcription termination/antitermination protein NusA